MRVIRHLSRRYWLVSAVLLPAWGMGWSAGVASAAPQPTDWLRVMGECLLVAAGVWVLSFFRSRKLASQNKTLMQKLSDRTAELEAEKSVLNTLQKLPSRDRLTMAWNRTAIMDILVREMLRSVRESSCLGIVIAEVDDLKGISERHGASGVDAVVQQTAERLLGVMRAYDAVGHYRDGDFLIVLPGWNPESAPQRIVSILDTMGLKPCVVGESPLRVTSSLGVAAFDPRTDSPYPEDLLRRADEALHMSKAAGPNHAVVAPR